MKKIISILLLIIWMIVIFAMSNFAANESSNQSGAIVTFLSDMLSISNIDLLTKIVRKLAHFTEYFVLGVLTINVFKDYNLKNIFLYSLVFCIFYACTDEIHQLFIPGRNGNIIDVLIDSFGAIVGCSSYFLLLKNKIFSKI